MIYDMEEFFNKMEQVIIDEVSNVDYTRRCLNLYNFVFAIEIKKNLFQTAMENCYGCHIDHGSQKQHDCVMLDQETQLGLYFEKTLDKVEVFDVVEDWYSAVHCTNIPAAFIDSFILKLQDEDWQRENIPRNEEWKDKQFEMVERLIRLDHVMGDGH